MLTKARPSRATTWFVLCSIVAMLYFAKEFLLPIAIAVFVAFALAPLVQRLERIGLPRIAATILTTATVGVLVVGVGWLLVGELRDLVDQMPGYRANVRAKTEDVRQIFVGPFEQASNTVRDLGHDLTHSAADLATEIAIEIAPTDAPPILPESTPWAAMRSVLGSMAVSSVVVGLVFLLAFVMLLRWEDLRDRMLALAGENELEVTTRAAQEASARIGRYLRRQLLLNIVHGVAMGLILWWVGVPNPLVWALLGATLRFVPYLGPVISTVAPIFVSFASSEGWVQTWITVGSLVGLEIVSNNVLEPWIYGAATGISPFALIVSTAFWTWIWGPMGLVLSAPLTVCLLVVGKRFPALRFLDVLFREEPAYSRRTQLYHRLLANDLDEAWDVLHDEIASSGLPEALDRTLMPALGLAGVARSDGRIDFEAREQIGSLAHALVNEVGELHASHAPPPPTSELRVVCFPARDAFDAVGSRLLVEAATRQGFRHATCLPVEQLPQVLDVLRAGGVDVVVVSSVVPTHFLHVRSLCKRLLALEPRVEILVGLWAEEMPIEEARRRFPDSPRVHVVTKFTAALAWLAQAEAIAAARRTA